MTSWRTDMKISDGAVESVAQHICMDRMGGEDGCCHDPNGYGCGADKEESIKHIRFALTYYAAHPEELPQEVVDAVMRHAAENNPQWLALLKYQGIIKTEGF